jgi:multicomponent Na+:H+ antiporter subunit G
MPDFYTRMHAASVTDTLGAALRRHDVQAGLSLVTVARDNRAARPLSPTATHALAKAGMTRGVLPLRDRENDHQR